MKRILIAVLALTVFVAGASVATAKRGGSKGAKERVFTLKPDPVGEPRGRRVRQALALVLRQHHGRRRHLPRLAQERHGRAVHQGRDGQVRRRPEDQARQALRCGRRYRLDHRLRPRHQGAGREVRDGHGRLPQRPRRHPWRRRLRDRLAAPDAVARDGEQVEAGSGTPQELAVGARSCTRRGASTSTASSRRARASSSWSTPTAASCSGSSSATTAARSMTSTRSPAPPCRAATACCSTAASSWSSRAIPPQLSFLKLRHGAREAKLKRTQTSTKLRGPSTVDAAKGLYLVVNADFATSTKPFTVAGLPRKAKHGHDDHGHGHGHDD